MLWSQFLTPSNALIALLAIGLLGSLGRRSTWGPALAVGAALSLCALSVLPVGDVMLGVLENRFPPPAKPPREVEGVLLLGGGVSAWSTAGAVRAQPNEAADRLFTAAALARKYPRAKVVVVGGPVRPGIGSEADFAADYLQQLGVSRTRILKERRSADTFGNAVEAAALLHPRPRETWLLVTSAYHMPRAVGAFRQAGFAVLAEPADLRAAAPGTRATWSAVGSLRTFDLAVREYVGLTAYYLASRSHDLFPAP